MVGCCLATPLIIGAAGALTLGAILGIAAAAIAILAFCMFAASRFRPERRG
jgi:hypothetical protein